MQLILTKDVPKLGLAGELVTVKAGFGRNYLLPKGLALSATTKNVKELEAKRRIIAAAAAVAREAAASVAERLGGMTLQFSRLVGPDEKLFGSVTSRDISERLEKAGITIDHRKINLPESIKALGKYEATVTVATGTTATLRFWVVAKDEKAE